MSEPAPYQLVRTDSAREAQIHFHGPFEGREVLWQACIRCVPPDTPQFIDVGEAQGNTIPITIGLHVAVIDEPALRKTVRMVRQYRLLRRGRYEFMPGGN